MPDSPSHFKKGDIVRDVYRNNFFEIIEPDKKGMAKLKQIDTGYIHNLQLLQQSTLYYCVITTKFVLNCKPNKT